MSRTPWKRRECRVPLIHSSQLFPDARFSAGDIVGDMFPISVTQLERGVSQGIFPAPKWTAEGARWDASVLREYIDQCHANPEPERKPERLHVPVPEGYGDTLALVRLLNVSRQTIHSYRQAGRIPQASYYNGKPYWSPAQMADIAANPPAKGRMPELLAFAEAVDGDQYVSIRDFCSTLGISGDALQEHILAGQIPEPIVVGGYGVYPRTLLEQLDRDGVL